MASKNLAVYAFSGDPITFGHIDIIERALTLFPNIIVAIGTNPDKNYTFTAKERERLAKEALAHLAGVTVRHFKGLLVDFAYEQKARAIIKGVRDTQDFAYEQTLHSMSVSQNYGIETVVLFARPALAHISSSTVKMLQKSQGLTHEYVPLSVKVALEKKLNNRIIIGMTGEIASGKTTAAQHIVEAAQANGQTVHHIDLDVLAHQIQNELNEPRYKAVRAEIIHALA
jgi:pantetheine-phosphate adenylyltransferase